jgi:hypothetical protein
MVKPRNTQDQSGLFRKGVEEMKAKSKGNIFKFIEDASKDPELKKKMDDMVKGRGKGETPEGFLKKFYNLGYDGVSLEDCTRILITLERAPHAGDVVVKY